MTASAGSYPVRRRQLRYAGKIFQVVTDEVTMPGGNKASRDYLRHPGSVGVVAVDNEDRVVLIRQYRHPVGMRLWEVPAGLVDVAGEDLATAAARELAEEADLVAAHWSLLIDTYPSPGSSNEVIRLFLARGLLPAGTTHQRHDEEADLEVQRFDLDQAVRMALAGEITNSACLIGLLVAARLRDQGWPLSSRPLYSPLPHEGEDDHARLG